MLLPNIKVNSSVHFERGRIVRDSKSDPSCVYVKFPSQPEPVKVDRFWLTPVAGRVS